MPQRIETDAAELPSGVVAEAVGDKSMRGFMKGNRNDEREYPD